MKYKITKSKEIKDAIHFELTTNTQITQNVTEQLEVAKKARNKAIEMKDNMKKKVRGWIPM